MRKFVFLSLVLMLLLSSFAVLASVPSAHAEEPAAPKPGSTWLKYHPSSVSFVQNDAYETGLYDFPYQYMAVAWGGKNNQRITVELTLGDSSGKGPDFGWFNELSGAKPEAELIQYPSWVNHSAVNSVPQSAANTGWIKAYSWDYSTSYTGIPYWPAHAYFTFLTNSTTYKPGFFEIDIKIQFQGLWGHTWWETIAKIYGVFTVGNMDVKNFKDAVTTDTTSVQLQVSTGKWHVEFWYVGTSNDYSVAGGVVTGSNVKEMKDFGNFTSKDNPVNLEYTFNASDPTGMYVWLYKSVNPDFETLYAFTTTVHNNATVLAGNAPPSISISFSGKPKINNAITITISATDDNSTTIQVWIMAFYSQNVYMQPDPSTPLMQLWMYPLDVPNGGNKSVSVQLKNDGDFNVVAIGKDDQGAFNITRSFVAVQGFEGGVGGIIDNSNPWIEWPWSSTVNMIILVVGIMLMFTRRPTLQIIGVLVFMAAFLNWGYVGHYLQQQLTGWIPHLGVLS